ncbi:SDR family NAD(P)-dependent oxidoreductase [Clostridium saccharoperbutylacetonicum]
MKIEFNNKLVVVTGGAGGIGMVCAKNFLEAGAKVAIIDISSEAIENTEKELSQIGEIKGYVLDISKVEAIGATVSKIREDMGEIEILIQTAGLLRGGKGLEIDKDAWDLMMNINTRGMFFVMQEVIKQSMKNSGGSIVNFASMAGIRGMNAAMASAHYSASKGAVVSMTMQAAVEWAEYRVRVNAVAPGGVKTKAMANMEFHKTAFDPIPLKKLSEPQDIANSVVFLASDKAAMITGQTLVIDGGSSIVGY